MSVRRWNGGRTDRHRPRRWRGAVASGGASSDHHSGPRWGPLQTATPKELSDVVLEAIEEMVSVNRAEVDKLSSIDLHGVGSLKRKATYRFQHIEHRAAGASHEIRLPSVDGGAFPIQ